MECFLENMPHRGRQAKNKTGGGGQKTTNQTQKNKQEQFPIKVRFWGQGNILGTLGTQTQKASEIAKFGNSKKIHHKFTHSMKR